MSQFKNEFGYDPEKLSVKKLNDRLGILSCEILDLEFETGIILNELKRRKKKSKPKSSDAERKR